MMTNVTHICRCHSTWLDGIKSIKELFPDECFRKCSPMQEPGTSIIRAESESHIVTRTTVGNYVAANLQRSEIKENITILIAQRHTGLW